LRSALESHKVGKLHSNSTEKTLWSAKLEYEILFTSKLRIFSSSNACRKALPAATNRPLNTMLISLSTAPRRQHSLQPTKRLAAQRAGAEHFSPCFRYIIGIGFDTMIKYVVEAIAEALTSAPPAAHARVSHLPPSIQPTPIHKC
jgi:hypothetical protein